MKALRALVALSIAAVCGCSWLRQMAASGFSGGSEGSVTADAAIAEEASLPLPSSNGVNADYALLALALLWKPVQVLRSGATGRALVQVLAGTGVYEIAYAVLLAVGIALSS